MLHGRGALALYETQAVCSKGGALGQLLCVCVSSCCVQLCCSMGRMLCVCVLIVLLRATVLQQSCFPPVPAASRLLLLVSSQNGAATGSFVWKLCLRLLLWFAGVHQCAVCGSSNVAVTGNGCLPEVCQQQHLTCTEGRCINGNTCIAGEHTMCVVLGCVRIAWPPCAADSAQGAAAAGWFWWALWACRHALCAAADCREQA